MAFRKFQAEKIFDGKKFLDQQQVLITTGQGIIEDIVPASQAGEDIEQFNGIISPGFINCHCHLELSHMKGRIPEKTGLVDFVLKVVNERHHPTGEIFEAVAEAEEQMIQNGIVAVGDICNNALTIPQKQHARVAYYNFIEASGWLPTIAGPRLERSKILLEQYQSINHQSATHCSIVPHAPYSVSQNLWQAIQPYFEGKTVTVHNQETVFEDDFFRKGTGDFTRMYEMMQIDNSHHQPTSRSSLQSYFDKLAGAKNVLLVHNTFTSEQDIEFLRSQEAAFNNLSSTIFFCLCINANQYIENAVPPIEMLRKNNCTMVLGTDSLASNRSLSIAEEMKTIRKHFPGITLAEMLTWATSNGAKALDMDNEFGSFEKGKKPGIVHFPENLSFIERLL